MTNDEIDKIKNMILLAIQTQNNSLLWLAINELNKLKEVMESN